MTDESQASVANPKGFLTGIGDSLRAHVDERLKSPFGGAFIVAWLAINWKSILILFFSNKSIEDRIEVVLGTHADWNTWLWHPIALAFLIAVGFYILSAVFLVFVELYEWVKGWIERRFDAVRWVSPTTYVQSKKRYNEQIRSYQELASDNLSAVNAEKEKTNQVAAELLKVQEELNRVNTAQTASAMEQRSLLERINEQSKFIAIHEAKAIQLSNDRSRAGTEIARLASRMDELQGLLSKTNAPTHPSAWNQFLIIRNGLKAVASLLSGNEPRSAEDGIPISSHSLTALLESQFPGLPVDFGLLSTVIEDMKASGLSSPDTSISDIYRVINSALPAIMAYREERPEVFQSSVDYLSKALGFMYPRFRDKHRFAPETQSAFIKYKDLIGQGP